MRTQGTLYGQMEGIPNGRTFRCQNGDCLDSGAVYAPSGDWDMLQGLVLPFLQTLIHISILSSAFLPEIFDPLFTGKQP